MTLKKLFADILKISPDLISEDTGPKNQANWDSLRHIEVVLALENKYDVRFSTAEIIAINSLESARKLLVEKGVEINNQ